MGNNFRDMTKKARRIGAVLNGRSRQGQSLVELVFTLPILALMFFGMVEIGWYANNYLILFDASREAGRYGATQDPIRQWDYGYADQLFRHDCCWGAACSDPGSIYRNSRPEMADYYASEGIEKENFYFDGVACQVLFNLSPLEFKWDQDEVVVSVFSYVRPYNPTDYPDDECDDLACGDFSRIAPSFPGQGGRFPIDRNRCMPSTPANHIGFTLSATGNHQCNPDTGEFCANHRRQDGCYGSEWDPEEVEARLYESEDGEGLAGGIVLVEIFWWHEQLLAMPFFTWLENPTEVYVWTMFPVSSAEPTPTPKP